MGDLEQMLSKNDPQESNLPHGISVSRSFGSHLQPCGLPLTGTTDSLIP